MTAAEALVQNWVYLCRVKKYFSPRTGDKLFYLWQKKQQYDININKK